MADLIDRDDLFEAMSKYHKKAMAGFDWVRFNEVMQSIVDLPPAKPDVPDTDVGDLISRQAAVDAILHNQEVYSNNFGSDPIDRYTIAIIDNDAQTIAQLPSAQPDARLKKIADLVDGTIDHFDRDDAMDLLYQIKEVLKNG